VNEAVWFTEAERAEMYTARNKVERVQRVRALVRLALQIGDEIAARGDEENDIPRTYLNASLSDDAGYLRSASLAFEKEEDRLRNGSSAFAQWVRAVSVVQRLRKRAYGRTHGFPLDFDAGVGRLACVLDMSFAECMRVEKMYQTLVRAEPA
jgi:hypothetical protein